MFKKNFRDIYLIGISFIAGVLFIVQCGGAARSIAETVANALDVSFDNSDTSLSSDNLQDAVEELASFFPFVYDVSGNKIGVFLSNSKDGIWEIWDASRKISFEVIPTSGEVFSDLEKRVYFESTDCSGTPYLLPSGSDGAADDTHANHPVQVNGQLYWYVNGGSTKTESDINSSLTQEGTCNSSPSNIFGLTRGVVTGNEALEDVTRLFVQAVETEEPTYSGPLFVN